MTIARGARLFGLAFAVMSVCASAASAQSRVRVVRDSAIIWGPGFVTMAARVPAGTILEAVSRMGDWYEVLLPSRDPSRAATGFILMAQVELVAGSQPPPERQRRPATGQRTGPTRARRRVAPPPPIGVRGFGNLGYDRFTAHQSFEAVLGQPGGFLYGGGGEVRFQDRVFVQVSWERFRKTGQRVFVFNNNVSKLGIPDTVTVTPFALTGGYRFVRRDAIPYIGGGVGRLGFTEVSSFADPSENVDQHATSYHVIGGVEWRAQRWVGAAIEAQYTHVPNALGVSGASAAFGEHNLGGFVVRFKLLVGR